MDDAKMKDLSATCSCGSDAKAGSCCKGDETCACDSGKPAKECCFKGDGEKKEE